MKCWTRMARRDNQGGLRLSERAGTFPRPELQALILTLRYFGCKCSANYLRFPYC
jgi:hypothetical protein